jgi:tungstate transport system substrate-binding protein
MISSGHTEILRGSSGLLLVRAALAALIALLMGCGAGQVPEAERLILASTTSTEDSGLFTHLLPAFGAAHPEFRVVVIAVGTGEALAMGERGDADILLVHAPAAESAFVSGGHGTERREVMYNDFVVVGPEGDPAAIRGLGVAAAFRRIAEVEARFISRGDDSGTHKREVGLWEVAGITPGGEWYASAGQGMGEVLRIASERYAYTLTDRATYLFMREQLGLEILIEGDDRLLNIYGVIPVAGSPKLAGAEVFMEWITGGEGQALIGGYGVERFGSPLFVPSAR